MCYLNFLYFLSLLKACSWFFFARLRLVRVCIYINYILIFPTTCFFCWNRDIIVLNGFVDTKCCLFMLITQLFFYNYEENVYALYIIIFFYFLCLWVSWHKIVYKTSKNLKFLDLNWTFHLFNCLLRHNNIGIKIICKSIKIFCYNKNKITEFNRQVDIMCESCIYPVFTWLNYFILF